MTKYFRTPDRFTQRPPGKPAKGLPHSMDSDKPGKDPQPSDANKPVDPDPSLGDPILDLADKPILQA